MIGFLEKTSAFLDEPLDEKPRVLLVLASLLLVLSYLLPLWTLTMFAPQYPEGLRLAIYSYKLDGGNGGQDVKEINVLNHYIGMHELSTDDFTEFKWIPFVLGGLGLLFLRAAVLGRTSHVLDVLVMYVYFGAFSLWSFGYKMYRYGHDLAPTASVKVPPFMPPMFGYRKLANFEVYSYPGAGSYALGAVVVVLGAAVFLAWRSSRPRAVRLARPSP
jgi:copper chaperone NosL